MMPRVTSPGTALLAVHLDRSSMLRPLLPGLRAGLADLLEDQAGPGEPEVVVATGNDLTRSLSDGSHPPAVPTSRTAARAALPARLRALDGPDLRTGAARLLDAVGDELAARDEADRPERVVVLLVGEAAVGDTTEVRERITHQQAAYAWEIVLVDVTSGGIPVAKVLARTGGAPAADARSAAASTAAAPAAGTGAVDNRADTRGADSRSAAAPEPAARDAAGTGDAAAGARGGTGTVLGELPGAPAAAARFGVPATATITAGPGAAGVTAALAAASAFVTRARAARPHEPVEGFSDAERAAAEVPDTRPAWRKFLRLGRP